ncbi:LAETG motif-containing sortase-dependent surface protein [Streptomyces sp. NPDC059649]|uniref:LAETG motif-containing sortase-dependent surface protein n=1 Tax=Streptomyces sp. NPDC059649 TaxID=3346895 RepID=UPI003683B565
MKLRRALTAAAATAVIAPAALMAAPAAFATGADAETTASAEPTPGTPGQDQTDDTATQPETPAGGDETTPGDETKPGEETGAGGESATGGETGETGTGGETATGGETGTGGETATGGEDGSGGSGDDTKPTGEPKPSTSAKPTAKPTGEPTDDTCAEQSDETAISTELRGLPSKVVAGSGWKNFTFRATNTSDKSMKSVDAYVALDAISADSFDDVSKLLTVQWYDEDSRTWEAITDEDGYFASVDGLKPGEYADAKLRLKVDAKTPGSYGFAFTIGAYHNEDDVCGFSDVAEYDFDVLVAGSKPGSVPPAKSKPGKNQPNKPAPQGDLKQLPVTGKLAETGSSSALPTIALVGGVAMVVGAGALFVVRRRKTDGTAAA